ncbi:uncharacterized protein LOC121869293 [Homarus americanus]|uniref:uncharacterized protein LOC121869293 n=1 Tax=Homarus americanus TaxID=6706 RepID=UPI001C45EDEE|nr:uncharacterized protein LOC121869293 [Homarus americanus]
MPGFSIQQDLQAKSCSGGDIPSTQGLLQGAIITDRRTQLKLPLWQDLLQFLGASCHRTMAYHPQSNGMVKRFHCQLKDSIKAQPHPYRWVDVLPPALRQSVASFKVIAPYQSSCRPNIIPTVLLDAEQDLVRRDAHRTSLQHPYDGPFPVISCSAKFLMIDCFGRYDTACAPLASIGLIHSRLFPKPSQPASLQNFARI